MSVVIVVEGPDDDLTQPEADRAASRFERLPISVQLADTITSAETVVRSGPDLQRDPEREFMLRYAIL